MTEREERKGTYAEVWAKDPTLPIFSQPWWLDAVCGEDNWDVLLSEIDGRHAGAMPFYLKRRGLFKIITMPTLTQKLGPHIRYRDGLTHSERLSWDKQVIDSLVAQLPRFDHFVVACDYRLKNWLPFYWAGFGQRTYYTYMIPDISDMDRVQVEIAYSKRKDIKKAAKVVDVHFDLPAREFYDNHVLTLRKQDSEISYGFELFERIYNAAYARNAGRTIYAKDREGNLHAALFAVWGPEGAYDLISTIDPDFRRHGAASLLILELIRHVSAFTNRFDFEGSMIEPVEASFRRFGAVQTPYSLITKTPSRLLKARVAARDLLLG